jgi:ABC-2 type transport system ATP-binding protein
VAISGMALSIQQLSKIYGQQHAVDYISFEVGEGEIVGFLGPNGAGKSTTMKIATTYIAPTAGSVRVGGYDVQENPLEVRSITGYLPEHNPLYLDMYVHEYLRFIGKLYGLNGSRLSDRVKEMIKLCGLTDEQNKKIETLSKGYRQRVGLAQALIHDPQVLILDEPTSGLDPNQLVEIRNLIKEVSKNKTVLFSTHIMQEVQALCSRVVVINKGKLVADDRIENLLAGKKESNTVLVEFEGDISINDLRELDAVEEVQQVGPMKYKVISRSSIDLRPVLFRFAADKNLSLVGLKQEEGSLEEIFKSLTSSQAS